MLWENFNKCEPQNRRISNNETAGGGQVSKDGFASGFVTLGA